MLYLNSALVIDNSGEHANVTVQSSSRSLTAGVSYPIVVQMWQGEAPLWGDFRNTCWAHARGPLHVISFFAWFLYSLLHIPWFRSLELWVTEATLSTFL